MAYTQTDLDQIRALIASGAAGGMVRTASGRVIKLASLAELRSIRDEIEAALGLPPSKGTIFQASPRKYGNTGTTE